MASESTDLIEALLWWLRLHSSISRGESTGLQLRLFNSLMHFPVQLLLVSKYFDCGVVVVGRDAQY